MLSELSNKDTFVGPYCDKNALDVAGRYISLTPSPWTTPIWTTKWITQEWTTKWTTRNGLP